MRVHPRRIPPFVRKACRKLVFEGFETWIVGGAVRDLARRKKPKDWDVATSAKPEEVEACFSHTVPTGKRFGTITVWMSKTKALEVTTFRKEGAYKDARHPEKVVFQNSIFEDLSRRDFTINAMALDSESGKILDPFGGLADLKRRTIRTVGKARERFEEDALRPVRAGRFRAQLGFEVSPAILEAAKKTQAKVEEVAKERIQLEFSRLLLTDAPSLGIEFLRKTRLLDLLIPELLEGRGVTQGGQHTFDVYQHTLRVLEMSPMTLELRWAALLHDIAKPRSRVREGRKIRFTGHEKQGETMAKEILRRLKYPLSLQKKVLPLIRHHLFEAGDVLASEASLRRFLRRVGEENVEALLQLREADVRGCGPKKRVPSEIDEIRRAIRREKRRASALHTRDLRIDGRDIMKELGLRPGPEVGAILQDLLEKVIENPRLNDRQEMLKRIRSLKKGRNDRR